MSTSNLTMYRGDTKAVQFTVSNLPSTGLTGYRCWMTVKTEVDLADAAAVFQKVPTDFTVQINGSATVAGVVQCIINPADTASQPDYTSVLLYDFQVEDANGVVTTAATGTLTVLPDVTRTSI